MDTTPDGRPHPLLGPEQETREGYVGALGRKTAMPPIRATPDQPDEWDGKRRVYFHSLIRSQDQALLARDREIEGNLRMLAGSQWEKWHPALERFVDVGEWMRRSGKGGSERIQATVNRLLRWYLVTHARLTENPPVVTYVPGPDRMDAELAEVLDVIAKIQWRGANMVDVLDRLYAWLIPAGTAFLGSRIDLTQGEYIARMGSTDVPLHGPDGQPVTDMYGQPVTVPAEGVPLGEDYRPVAFMQGDYDEVGQVVPQQLVQTGEPHYDREGQIAVDVLSAFACRGQWGDAPWHQKSWHSKSWFGTPEEIYDRLGVEVDPTEARKGGHGVTGTNQSIFESVLFGAGWYGAAASDWAGAGAETEAKGQLVRVDEVWCAPNPLIPDMAGGKGKAGGRHIAMTAGQVIFDRPRELAYPFVSPLNQFTFVKLPGRHSGTTVQTALNPLQRAHNKAVSMEAEHAQLTSNPIALIDTSTGFDAKKWKNTPGAAHSVNKRPGIAPIEWLSPPTLGSSVGSMQRFTQEAIEDIGATRGTDAGAESGNESGEVRRERRYDGDRYVGPTQRRTVEEIGRMLQTHRVMYPLIYTEQRILRDAGEDQIARTVTVMPHLFDEGTVDVVPDLASMLPETREERRTRLSWMLDKGLLGDTPQEARRNFLEMAQFPNLARASRVGGIDAVTAAQENGALLRGEGAAVKPWYGHAIHIQEHLRVMKTPEYLKLDMAVQQAFESHVEGHEMIQAQMAPPPPPPTGPVPGMPSSDAPPPQAPPPQVPGPAPV